MNTKRTIWLLGQASGVFCGISVGIEYSFAAGVAVAIIICLLSDIRMGIES